MLFFEYIKNENVIYIHIYIYIYICGYIYIYTLVVCLFRPRSLVCGMCIFSVQVDVHFGFAECSACAHKDRTRGGLARNVHLTSPWARQSLAKQSHRAPSISPRFFFRWATPELAQSLKTKEAQHTLKLEKVQDNPSKERAVPKRSRENQMLLHLAMCAMCY